MLYDIRCPVAEVGESVLWFVFMWALLKVTQKLDTFIGKLGIEVGSVGGSLFEEIMIGKMAFGALTKGIRGGGKDGKSGGAIASAMSAVTGGRGGGSVLASALAGGAAVGAGGVVGRAAMGALGKITKGSLLGGLITNGNPLNGGKQNLGANVANAMPTVAKTKASKAAKILNENPKGGGEEFSEKLKKLMSQNGVTPNLVNQLNRDIGGERGKQIMKGLIGKKSFGDLKPEMVNSQGFEATAFQGGVKWSYQDAQAGTQLKGFMAVHGNNSATEAANKFKNANQDAYHYTSNAPGGRKISCVYTISTAPS